MTKSAPNARAAQATRASLGRLSRAGGTASVLAIALPLLSGALLLVQAGLIAHILHQSITSGLNIVALAAPLAWLSGLFVVRIGLGFCGELSAISASETVKLRMRTAMVGTMLGHQPTWTAARSSGAMSSAVIEQVEAMDGYLTRYLPAMAQAALLPLAFAVLILPIDWVVSLLFLITAPLIPVFMALAGLGAQAASDRQAQALSRLSGYFADRLRGLTTLKLFGREAAETNQAGIASDELRTRTMRVMRIAFLSSAVLEFFAALGVAGVALYVGLTFLDLVSLRGMPLSLEAGLFCLLMAPEVYQPLRLLAANYHDQAAAKAAVAEITAQLGEVSLDVPVKTESGSGLTMVAGGGLTLTGLSVNAPDGRVVVTGVDLDVAAGEHIAIMGASGCGKSTLIEAVAGLREFSGKIAFGGVDLEDLSIAALRTICGVVGQRPTIFAGSIADNIRLGRRNACDTAVHLAAQKAHVTAFSAELPDGLGTQLGDNGLGLSGGEIHRVALARLYLRTPQILLLDEPTAHLDAATEAAVLDELVAFAHDRTMIIVTHSPAVAARMDRCFWLVGGRLLPMPLPRMTSTKIWSAA